MNIEILFLTIHSLDYINYFKVNNNNSNNNNKLLNNEAVIRHFLIILLTFKMLIQIHNKYTINLIRRIFKKIFKVNDLFNSFRLDNYCNLCRYQTRSF